MTFERHKTSTAITGSWGLFAAVGLLMLGNGLLGTLLGIRSELEGFATTATGVVMASYFVGFLFGSRIAPKTMERVGHVRVFAALASLASASPLVHSVFVDPVLWGAMRFVFGFCMAGLYVVAESWLNQAATNETRGRLLSVYMLVTMGGLGTSQLLIGIAAPTGFKLFVLASLLVSLAVVPISLSQGRAPEFHAPETLRLAKVWQVAPLGIVGGIGAGVTSGALVAIGPVYATRIGFSSTEVAWVIGVALLGSLVWQWPIGLMSDRVPRRRAVLLITTLAAVVAAVGAQASTPGLGQLLVVMFFLGGLTFPMYSVVLSHINDVISYNQAVAASSLYVFVSGLGAILGPLLAALAIATIGAPGFFVVIGGAHALVAIYALFRISVKPAAVGRDEQTPWRPFPARAGVVLARLTKARRPAEDGRSLRANGDVR
jgi:MFS family permease